MDRTTRLECISGNTFVYLREGIPCARDSDTCEVYHHCGDDCPEWRARTNADCIRSMSDEKLAEFLLSHRQDYCHSGSCHKGETCMGCMMKWLKQPIKAS